MKQKSYQIISKQKKEVEHQRDLVNEKNHEILSSIEYAKKIQRSILPPRKLVKEYMEQTFIYFRPKDIVSGDFYWFDSINEDIYFTAADCTGHGVPGAMVSVVCSNALSKTVRELSLTKPSAILDQVAKIVEDRFDKGDGQVQDGMDLAFCKLNTQSNVLEYCGANNPLWIVRPKSAKNDLGLEVSVESDTHCLYEVKPDIQPIGKYFAREPFTNHSIQLQTGDSLYIFSDGYQDQFGGPRGKKYKAKPFKRYLLSIQDQSMDDQENLIHQNFEDYKGDEEQIDDVCVIGVRV